MRRLLIKSDRSIDQSTTISCSSPPLILPLLLPACSQHSVSLWSGKPTNQQARKRARKLLQRLSQLLLGLLSCVLRGRGLGDPKFPPVLLPILPLLLLILPLLLPILPLLLPILPLLPLVLHPLLAKGVTSALSLPMCGAARMVIYLQVNPGIGLSQIQNHVVSNTVVLLIHRSHLPIP